MTSWTNSGSGPSATAAGRKVSELFPCFGAAAGASDSSVFAPAAAPTPEQRFARPKSTYMGIGGPS